MEAATTPEQIETSEHSEQPVIPGEARPEDEPGTERSPAESRDSSRLFEFSKYVHVGPGAEECAEAETGGCDNNMHFHAWIRMPNQFQHTSLREKAAAAKARKLRQLRDVESDTRVILDGELEEIVARGDTETLIEQIVTADFLKDHLEAMTAVREDEEFEHIEEDRERLNALRDRPEEERSQEEYDELEKHINAYVERVNEEREKIQAPLRQSVEGKPIEELAEMVREQRILAIANDEFNSTYSLWEWFIGTLKPKAPDKPGLPSERIYGSVEHLKQAPPEVVDALSLAFREIEAATGRSLQAAADG